MWWIYTFEHNLGSAAVFVLNNNIMKTWILLALFKILNMLKMSSKGLKLKKKTTKGIFNSVHVVPILKGIRKLMRRKRLAHRWF